MRWSSEGSTRTWLKYIKTGEFPNTGRSFSVMRCNQCDDAPCMSICPTNALYRADNGVVDFDDDNCIGCKGCMNACPYHALYINPATNTAHKCNFCNHRVEVGLEPACVVVCPTHAIVTGDLDEPVVGIVDGRDGVLDGNSRCPTVAAVRHLPAPEHHAHEHENGHGDQRLVAHDPEHAVRKRFQEHRIEGAGQRTEAGAQEHGLHAKHAVQQATERTADKGTEKLGTGIEAHGRSAAIDRGDPGNQSKCC